MGAEEDREEGYGKEMERKKETEEQKTERSR